VRDFTVLRQIAEGEMFFSGFGGIPRNHGILRTVRVGGERKMENRLKHVLRAPATKWYMFITFNEQNIENGK